MTEIAGLGATHPLYDNNKHGSIGCAMPYCELRIADADDAGIIGVDADDVLWRFPEEGQILIERVELRRIEGIRTDRHDHLPSVYVGYRCQNDLQIVPPSTTRVAPVM